MSDIDYDVIIVGGGPGGYLCAERLGGAGKSVALIEADTLGGTCLNVGCIPTKSLLNSAKTYLHAKEAAQFGVTCGDVSIDWAQMQQWKDTVVRTLVGGVGAAQQRAGVDVITGWGVLRGPGVVEVGGNRLRATHVVVATGSVPVMPPIPGAHDNPAVLDSTGLLAIDHIPARLTVIGGGVIGLEFASLFAALGSTVTVVEMMPEIAPMMDADLAALLRESLSGVTVKLGCRVEAIDGSAVRCSTDGATDTIDGDVILMAVGRRPAIDGWGAEDTALDIHAGHIVVDDRCRTNLPNVWAIGDVTGRSLLAHAAYRMADVVAANICDPDAAQRGEVFREHTVPWCIYTLPEAAGIGLTASGAVAAGRDVLVGSAPGYRSGRFVAENGLRAPGLTTVVVDAATHQVLGIHTVGPYASEIIWGASAVLETELDLTDLRQLVVPHPTVSEVIREAAWAVPA